MQRLQRRLERIEEELIPKKRIAIFFTRDGHKEEDHARQLEEYKSLHGSTENLIVVDMKDYYLKDDYDDYETFIRTRRAGCSSGNCYCWWPGS